MLSVWHDWQYCNDGPDTWLMSVSLSHSLWYLIRLWPVIISTAASQTCIKLWRDWVTSHSFHVPGIAIVTSVCWCCCFGVGCWYRVVKTKCGPWVLWCFLWHDGWGSTGHSAHKTYVQGGCIAENKVEDLDLSVYLRWAVRSMFIRQWTHASWSAWLSSRTSVSGQRSFTVLRSTCSWRLTTYVGKPSTIGQPTRSTQPFILSGSINA